jgi:hypothetical protein
MTVTDGWLRIPVDPTAGDWLTVRTERTVLAIVHTLAGAVHIQDAVEQIESDPRIQVVFTQAPDLFSHRVGAFLDRLDGVTIPWQQAVHTRFDLAVVADTAEVHELRAPILLVPHGVMNNKLAPPALAGVSGDLVVGLAAPWLTRFGNLVPAAVALSHDYLIDVLALQCPPALAVARVVGDLCLDRLVASRANAERYREQFGVAQGQVLVAMSSTWGPYSLFGQWKNEVYEAAAALPPEYSAVAVMHPALWFGHGPRQIARWLATAHRNGLRLVDPLTWRALIAAADVLVGDHGSLRRGDRRSSSTGRRRTRVRQGGIRLCGPGRDCAEAFVRAAPRRPTARRNESIQYVLAAGGRRPNQLPAWVWSTTAAVIDV